MNGGNIPRVSSVLWKPLKFLAAPVPEDGRARALSDDAELQGVALVLANCAAARSLIEFRLNFVHRVPGNFSINCGQGEKEFQRARFAFARLSVKHLFRPVTEIKLRALSSTSAYARRKSPS